MGYDEGWYDGYNEGRGDGFEEGIALVKVEVPWVYFGEALVIDTHEQEERLWELIEILVNLDDYTAVPNAVMEFDWWSHDYCPK